MPNGASDTDAPIGTTAIILQTDDPAENVYKAAARTLQQKGYSLANTDSDLQTLTTGFRPVNPPGMMGATYQVKISAGVVSTSPTRLRLSGQMKTNQLGSSEIKKTGQDGSAIRNSWADLFTIAFELTKEVGGNLEYLQ